jgi:ubiquinone/menaquinone biosynthesis C-methylase UbiE
MIQEQEQTRLAWDKIAKGYAEFVGPTHQWLAGESLRRAGLRSGMRFLDVAAGTGALSIPAARLGAEVLSTDISLAMLQQLKMRAEKEHLNIKTRVMDGHMLDLEDNSFEIAGSQFGVMLFPDMPRGIREMVRVIKPNGRVLMNVYGNPQQIEFFSFFVGAIQSVRPAFNGPPMEPPPLPFQLHDPERLCNEMIRAGLKEVRVDTITEQLMFQSGKQLWDWVLNSNPIARFVLAELRLNHEEILVIQESLEKKVRERAAHTKIAILTNPINIGIGIKK